MGGGKSQSISQTFNLSSISKSIFTQITKNTQTLSSAMNNIQEVHVEIGVMKSGCTANIGQTINASSITSGRMEPQTIAETRDQVQADLQAAAQAALEQTTQMGNLEFGNSQSVRQNINMAIEQVVEKTFTTENLNEVYSEVVNIQEGKIIVGVCDGEINFDQNIVAELVAEAITKSLTSAISDNELLSKLAASASGNASMLNKGFEGLIEAFTGPMKYAIIASICCCCLLVVLLVVIGLSPAGQSATANLGKAGASRISNGRSF